MHECAEGRGCRRQRCKGVGSLGSPVFLYLSTSAVTLSLTDSNAPQPQ